MFLYICLILQSCLLIVYSEACADFYFGSSHYQATFVEANHYSEFKRWNEVTCQQTGYQLVSITTIDENNAILNFLENCTHGDYAIGLSRQAGTLREFDSSWKWYSRETVSLLNWGSNEPNVEDNKSAGVYLTTMKSYGPGKWYDFENIERIGLNTGSPGYGYICEKKPTIITTNSYTTRETTEASDEPRTNSNTATTHLFTTARGTSTQSLTSGVQHASISTTAEESTKTTYANTDEASRPTETTTHSGEDGPLTATQLSTTADETSVQLTSGRSMQPSSTNSTPTPKTVIDENKEGTTTSDKPSTQTTTDKATTQLSTTTDETSIQFTSGRPIQPRSTNSTPTLPTTIIDQTKEGNSASEKPSTKTTTDKATTHLSTTAAVQLTAGGISTQSFSSGVLSTTVIGEFTEGNNEKQTKANTNNDWITVVYVLASFVFVIVVLVLLYRLRERSCCKLKSKLDPELVMINMNKDQPLIDSTENGCCDADSTTKETVVYNSVYGKPSVGSANIIGQEKFSGDIANAIITYESTNEPSDISHEVDTYLGNQSTSAHERQNPDDYQSEENPTYESYKEEVKFADIGTQDEGEVDNPAYDALPFDGSGSLYASPDQMTDKPDMPRERNPQVESPGNNTIQSEAENDYASIDKMTDVAESGDALKETVAPVDDNDEVADSNIDVLYAKPNMSMKRKNRLENPGDNDLRSQTENDNALLDKMTDVTGSGDVSIETDASLVHEDDLDKVADSNIDALYAKPDMSMKRENQVGSAGDSPLQSETESDNYELSDKTTLITE